MTIEIRRLIFYALILAFFILTFFIIPYSNGLRFNFSTLTFERLGGLHLNVGPTGAIVQVDKLNFEIKSSFMKSGLLIANLFPKTYHVSIQKNGYQTWNKNVLIKPTLVTQIYPIILIPEKASEKLVQSNAIDLFLSSNYIAWKDTDDKLVIDGKIIKGTKFLAWLAGEKTALVYDEVSKNYLVINPAQNNAALNINLLFENLKYQETIDDKNSIKSILAHPSDKNKLILTTVKNLYILDFYKSTLEIINPINNKLIESEKNRKFTIISANGTELFIKDLDGLYSYNLSSGQEALLMSLGQDNVNLVEVSPNNQFVAFSMNNELILLDRSKTESKTTNLNVGSPSYIKFSPDSKKMAVVCNNDKIKVFFIGDDYELLNKNFMGISSFEINYLDSNVPIIWHNNSYYLFVKSGEDIKFMEINDDQPINLKTIDFGVDKYFYNRLENSLYVIKEKTVFKIITE